ncbi:MAG: hypothetical protein ACRDLM_11840 [Gaiellaceae bacterium]
MLRTGLVGCLVVLLVAACGGAPARQATPPKLPRTLAQRWAGDADKIAAAVQANRGCEAQQLARSLAREVDLKASRISARFRATVITAAAKLANRISCTPKPPKAPKQPKGPHGHRHGDGKGHGGEGG